MCPPGPTTRGPRGIIYLQEGVCSTGGRDKNVKILCISDRVEPMLHGPSLTAYAKGVEAVISCGDLPFDYLEYVITLLGAPVYYVLGNHDPAPEGSEHPEGCTPLDGRVVDAGGLVLAGLSGSRLYSGGPNQYTERQMRRRVRALSMRIRCRGLAARTKPRVFVSHAPPSGLGDREDPAHVGFESFLKLMDRHKPSLWLHGHVHLYGSEVQRVTHRGGTKVINVYGHRILEA
jgi:3',5'-cyclic AMP phosphodiesterase CpdA